MAHAFIKPDKFNVRRLNFVHFGRSTKQDREKKNPMVMKSNRDYIRKAIQSPGNPKMIGFERKEAGPSAQQQHTTTLLPQRTNTTAVKSIGPTSSGCKRSCLFVLNCMKQQRLQVATPSSCSNLIFIYSHLFPSSLASCVRHTGATITYWILCLHISSITALCDWLPLTQGFI